MLEMLVLLVVLASAAPPALRVWQALAAPLVQQVRREHKARQALKAILARQARREP